MLDRLRWFAKARNIRRAGLSVRRNLSYVLFDPEVESYTYTVANVAGLLATISEVTGVPEDELRRYAAEVGADSELQRQIERRVRRRFDVKRRPQLANRLGWYVLIRALRPALAVETGIYHGLGSLVLLHALERNATDGSPGELMSFDSSPDAGWIVDHARYPSWRHVVGTTDTTLERSLAGRRVGALFQDSDHSEAVQRLEFEAALANPEPVLLLVDASGGQTPVLEQLSRERGGVYRHVRLGASDHWYQRGALTFALFRSTDNVA
jgi:Methyltransferase domain